MNSTRPHHLTLFFRCSFIITLIAVTYFATSETTEITVFSISDKLNHLFAFFVLAAQLDYSIPESSFNRKKIIFLLFYGALIELIQYFLLYRTCSLADFFVDGVGILFYLLVSPYLVQVNFLAKARHRFKD